MSNDRNRGFSVVGRETDPRERRSSRVRPGLLGGLLAVAVLAITLAGCGGVPAGTTASPTAGTSGGGSAVKTQRVAVDGGSYTNVDAAGLASMLKTKDFAFINVHIPYEGEIEGTDQFLPYDTIESNLSKLPADKSAKIFLYCRSGNMSDIAARALVKHGYTNVWNLDGGMIGWTKAGYKTVEKTH